MKAVTLKAVPGYAGRKRRTDTQVGSIIEAMRKLRPGVGAVKAGPSSNRCNLQRVATICGLATDRLFRVTERDGILYVYET